MNWDLIGWFLAISMFGLIICGFLLLVLILYLVTR
jgi:hypothetical protein